MLVFRRQSKSTGHKCEGLQIYSYYYRMSTNVYIYICKQVFENLVTYSEVRNLQYNGPKVTEVMEASVIYL